VVLVPIWVIGADQIADAVGDGGQRRVVGWELGEVVDGFECLDVRLRWAIKKPAVREEQRAS
jgi:hypothetical protein